MITGNAETINRAKAKKSSDKTNTINWDALDTLPEEFEAVISEVKFDANDLSKSFSDVGGDSYMPKPELIYEIATARGISGGENSIVENLIDEVDINRMLGKPVGTPPSMQRRVVGKKVAKYATVLAEDGTEQRSSVCTIEYNVWERCCAEWSAEENDTQGYTVEIKDGKYTVFGKDKYGPHYYKGQYAYPIKYRSPHARQKHFDDEMKFAHAKAETKAHGKAVRELACLSTGYKKADLTEGVLYFAKIRRSAAVLKMETAARLQAMSRGLGDGGNSASVALFGPQAQIQAPQAEPNVQDAESERLPDDDSPFPSEPEPVQWGSVREEYIAALSHYSPKMIEQPSQKKAESILNWVKTSKECTSHVDWPKAIDFLKDVESKIPQEMKFGHNLY
jgi:hypothetical protein